MDVELDGEPEQVTHLGLVMVDPDAQGQGLSWVLYGLTTLVLFARDGLRPKWISNVTQVPAVVGMVCETFSDVFPSPHPDARQSFAHLQLARGIMRDHRAVFGVGDEAGFDEATLRHHRCLYRRIGRAEENPSTPRQSIATSNTMRSARASSITAGATMSCSSAASISPARAAICSARCRPARCRRCWRRPPCWRCSG